MNTKPNRSETRVATARGVESPGWGWLSLGWRCRRDRELSSALPVNGTYVKCELTRVRGPESLARLGGAKSCRTHGLARDYERQPGRELVGSAVHYIQGGELNQPRAISPCRCSLCRTDRDPPSACERSLQETREPRTECDRRSRPRYGQPASPPDRAPCGSEIASTLNRRSTQHQRAGPAQWWDYLPGAPRVRPIPRAGKPPPRITRAMRAPKQSFLKGGRHPTHARGAPLRKSRSAIDPSNFLSHSRRVPWMRGARGRPAVLSGPLCRGVATLL